MDEILRIEDLRTSFRTEGGKVRAVDGVSFTLERGEVLGIVGESGSGKSVTALSMLKLIPDPPGHVEGGRIWFKGRDLLALSYEEIRKVRGHEISMIFQEPMTSLDPVFSIGDQVAEAVLVHRRVSRAEALRLAGDMLEKVGIPDARERLRDYPHQFSGGMRQRVMIAMALVLEPEILLADEPTTALDVTIQAQILDLMLKLKQEKGSAIILITHDMAVVAETCRRVVVMYCGKVQEIASVDDVFHDPLHPYTRGLLRSLPDPRRRQRRLVTIPGMVPSLIGLPPGCAFADRCPEVMPACRQITPDLVEVKPGHQVRCHLHAAGVSAP